MTVEKECREGNIAKFDFLIYCFGNVLFKSVQTVNYNKSYRVKVHHLLSRVLGEDYYSEEEEEGNVRVYHSGRVE